ncbi:tetratricopeptide repeat protein [Desulforhabdus amnigena]|nr:tetratricopeptide repeat protein [Desulforhabdus amnigena]
MESFPVKSTFAWMFLILAAVSLSACAPKRYIAIPLEWQTPPPPPPKPSMEKPSPPMKQSVTEPPRTKGPVIKSAPEIREMDLPKSSETSTTPPASQKKPEPEPEPPQHLASMHLVDEAKSALAQGKPDAAIPLLEQAIQVDVYNGDAFWGLAKAWRMKGSQTKALEFARKAEILFQGEPAKLKEVYLFQADLFKEKGDSQKAQLYRQKAGKL